MRLLYVGCSGPPSAGFIKVGTLNDLCWLTMITAAYLSANGSHFVGLHPEGGAVLPLFGWSSVTGDLRPAHFAAMHAMQALPLLGLWLDRRGALPAKSKSQSWPKP